MARTKLIAGNWKMNCTVAESENLIKAILNGAKTVKGIKIVVCPPFTSLPNVAKILKGKKIELGAQDLSEFDDGAFTGEISGKMLKSLGVKYVIVGHSERRQFFRETSEIVRTKAKQALKNGLSPIICIGETIKERQLHQTQEIVQQQLTASTAGIAESELKKAIIAYEPVWAIGTGKTATPEMAQEVHTYIRSILSKMSPKLAQSIPIIYGGSVKPENATGLMRQPDIDGALVGGASLDAKSFISILRAA